MCNGTLAAFVGGGLLVILALILANVFMRRYRREHRIPLWN